MIFGLKVYKKKRCAVITSLIFVGLGFELWASYLQSRYSTQRNTSSPFYSAYCGDRVSCTFFLGWP
jgi:hypothetical protein